MKRYALIILIMCSCFSLHAQVTEAWITLPDSLCPYISQQQRYYLLQYANAGRMDTVKNHFDGLTYIDTLSRNGDYMRVQMTANMQWEVYTVSSINQDIEIRKGATISSEASTDNASRFICIRTTVCAPICSSVRCYYDYAWNLLRIIREPFAIEQTEEDNIQYF